MTIGFIAQYDLYKNRNYEFSRKIPKMVLVYATTVLQYKIKA